MKIPKQQRINLLAWEIIDIFLPENPARKDIQELENGLKQVLELLRQPGE